MPHVPDHFKTQDTCNKAVIIELFLLEGVPGHLKTQEMCDEAVRIEPILLWCVSDHFKTQDMCNQAVRNKPLLSFVPDQYITQEMCNEVVHPCQKHFTGSLTALKQKTCVKKTVEKDPRMLRHVPDFFKVGLS